MRPYKIKRTSKMAKVIESLGIHGLFNAEGHQWKNDRRLVGPTLNKKNIEDYFQNIKLVAGRLIAKWRNDKTVTTIMSDLSKYALDILALSMFGMDFDSISNPSDHELAANIEEMFKIVFQRSLSPFPYWTIPFCSNIDGGRDLSEHILNELRTLVRDYKKQKQDGGKMMGKKGRTCLQKLMDISEDDEDARLDEERVVGNLATSCLLEQTQQAIHSVCVCGRLLMILICKKNCTKKWLHLGLILTISPWMIQ